MKKKIKEPEELTNPQFIDEVDLEEYNKDIERAMKEIDEGKYYLHEDVVKKIFKQCKQTKK